MQQDIEVTLLGMNEIAREGLCRILTSENFRVKTSLHDGEATNCNAASGVVPDAFQIIIVDRGANGEGLEVCRQLNRDYPGCHIVLLADGYEYDEMAAAFRSGVDGYLVKEISCEPLFESLRLIALGEKVLPSQHAENLGSQLTVASNGDWKASARAALLSEREVEVLACLTMGVTNKVISRRHSISEATVKVHVKAILRKLRVANRTQAAIWAVRHGLNPDHLTEQEDSDLREDLNDEADGVSPLGYAA